MSKNIKEQIIKSINLQNNNFVDKDNITQSFQPRNAYLLPKIDGTHERFVTDDNNIISKQAGSSGGGTSDITKYANVSKTELDSLINNSNLEIGCLYIISQVDPNLYGGTTIYLTAINENTLSENGIGEFYNPKYDQSVAGFNVWTPNPPLVTPLVSFGSHYNVGDKVHWGGKTWVNVNGNVGNSIDIFTLDSEWQVIPYNENDYNVAYDEIKYDYDNDVIIYRNEKNSNIVSTSYINIQEWTDDWEFYNPIKAFMWGNTMDYDLWAGIGNQKIINSYNENINFRGLYQRNLTFDNNSHQQNLTFENYSYQDGLNFNNGSYQQDLTFDNNSHQQNLTFDNYSNQQNLTFENDSNQEDLTFDNNSYQRNLNFDRSSSQSFLTFYNQSYQYDLTFENTSGQINLNFNNSYQSNLTFKNSSFQRNLIFETSYQINLSFDNSNQRISTFVNGSFQRDLIFENRTLQEYLKFENRSFQMVLNFNNSKQEYLIFNNNSYQQNLTFNNNSYQKNLNFENLAYQNNLTFDNNSHQQILTFSNGSLQSGLTFDNSYQKNLTFENNSFQTNLTFDNSYQDNLMFENYSSQQHLTFKSNSFQSYLTFENNSLQSYLTFENNSFQTNLNFDNNSDQTNLNFDNNSNQQNLTFENDSRQNNLTFDNSHQKFLTLNAYRRNLDSIQIISEENLTFIGDLPEATEPTKMIVYENNQIKQFPIPSGGGNASGDYIPLTGTEEDKYLTGDIEIKSINNNGKPVGFKSEFVPVNGIRYSQNFGLQSDSNYMRLDWEFKNDLNPSASWFKYIRLGDGGITFSWEQEHYGDYSLVQKAYVDKAVKSASDIYPETGEVLTNKIWMGKPIYRRVLSVDYNFNSNNYFFYVDGFDIEKCIYIDGYIDSTGHNNGLGEDTFDVLNEGLYAYEEGTTNRISLFKRYTVASSDKRESIHLWCNPNGRMIKGIYYITIEYTKKTDANPE